MREKYENLLIYKNGKWANFIAMAKTYYKGMAMAKTYYKGMFVVWRNPKEDTGDQGNNEVTKISQS